MQQRHAREWTLFGLAVGLMSMLVLTTHASAQPPSDGPRSFRDGGGPRGMFAGLRQLDLSEDQREELRALREQNRGEGEARREQLRIARQALTDAVMTDAVNESLIRALAAELATLEADAAVQTAHRHAAMLQILTPSQREELEALRAERRERWEERMADRRGRRGSRR